VDGFYAISYSKQIDNWCLKSRKDTPYYTLSICSGRKGHPLTFDTVELECSLNYIYILVVNLSYVSGFWSFCRPTASDTLKSIIAGSDRLIRFKYLP